jgi:4-phytase/acid phosphatase
MKRFGSFDRASFAEAGLEAASGCVDAAATYIWADSEQRTIESGRALAEGLFPACPPSVHHLDAGANDPLFHPAAAGSGRASSDAAVLQSQEALPNQPNARQDELLVEMQRVLLGCLPSVACTPAHPAETPLTVGSAGALRGKGNHAADSDSPLAQASSFAEDFLLEYGEGLPENQVGWGQVDEPQLRRFLALHSDYFDLMHRTPLRARAEASNMLFHIVCTLEQGVKQEPVAGAVGPAASKVVIIAGHDTNIAGTAALLGLHWTLDGRRDDTPPGTELAFELLQNNRGEWSVRVTVAMQTLHQLREMQDLTLAAPPARETLTIEGCGADGALCSWEDFRRIAESATDKASIFIAQPN